MSSKQKSSDGWLVRGSTVIAVISALAALGFLAVRVFAPDGSPADHYASINQGDLFFGVCFFTALVTRTFGGQQ